MIENLNIETLIAAFVAICSAIYNIIQKVQNNKAAAAAAAAKQDTQSLADLMNPYVPQTNDQTEVAKKISPATYIMADADFDRLCRELTASGARFDIDSMRACIRDMEKNAKVEYLICVEDHDANIKTQSKWAVVSYGVPVLVTQDEAIVWQASHYAPAICPGYVK